MHQLDPYHQSHTIGPLKQTIGHHAIIAVLQFADGLVATYVIYDQLQGSLLNFCMAEKMC